MFHKNKFILFHLGFISLLLILTFVSNSIFSQGYYRPHPFLSPMWQIEGEYLPATQIIDSNVSNGFTGANFAMRVPLWKQKDLLDANGGKPFIAVLSHFGVSGRQTQIDFFEPKLNLTIAKLGVSGVMAKGLRNLYLMQGFISMPTSDFSIELKHTRYHTTALWRHLYHNNKWWHTLGLTYTPIMGKDILLPVAGAGVQLSNENQLQFTFPFNITYTHLFTKKLSISMKVNNFGGYHFFKSDSLIKNDWSLYRFNYQRGSLIIRYYTDRFVVFTAEAGLTSTANLKVNETKFYQQPSIYMKVGFQIRFGARPPAAPILNFDPGESGFDPNYIVE